jgi:hypothetical protein
MEAIRIQLSGMWVALMLSFLLGDVLRIFIGDFKTGEIGGKPITQVMGLAIAAVMVIPVVMIVLTLMMTNPAIRWVNIIVAVFFFVFNIIGLPTYAGVYDKFLIVIGLMFNVMTIWVAWNWAG